MNYIIRAMTRHVMNLTMQWKGCTHLNYKYKLAAAALLAITTMTTPLMSHTYAQAETSNQVTEQRVNEEITSNAFLNNIANDAVAIANDAGLYASVMMAQAALESNYGKSGLASAPNYNLFGIKGQYNGQSASFSTKEQKNDGTVYETLADFRQYDSYEQSLRDYAELLSTTPYYVGTLKANTMSYKDALTALQGKYATDQQYASKLQEIIDTYDLARFDQLRGKTIITNEDGTTTTQYVAKKVISVVKGDSLSTIARTYDVTVDELMEWNGLQSTLLAIGDELIVSIDEEQKAYTSTQQNEVVAKAVEKKQVYKATKKHKVKRGDSLTSIAKKYRVSSDDLKEWNDLSTAKLTKGQKLIVAIKRVEAKKSVQQSEATKVETKKKATKTEAKIKPRYYTVQQGDSLASIARAFTTTETKLKQLNGLKSSLVYTGQKVKTQ